MQRLLGAFLGLIAALAAASARADDNPFGLPVQRDSKRPGSVMLHGGGDGLADEVRQEFVRLAGGHDARIVLMPSDMCQLGKDEDGRPLPGGETIAAYERRVASPRQYGRWAALGAAKQVASFQFLYHNPIADPDDSKFFAALEQATGVWLPVYDQEWLPKQFASDYPNRMSRFQLALRDVVARGGVVGGLGGGMSSLPETVIAGDAPSERGWVRADVRFGLALFNGAVVDRSFDARAGRLERLTEMLRNGPRLNRLNGTAGVERRTIGLGVERETVAILQGNTVRAMGEGRVHIFLKANGDRTIVWRTIEAGDEPLAIHSNSAAPQRREVPSANLKADFVNPFGMPEPADPAHPGAVVLHGGGNKDEIVELFPKLAREAKPRLVLCPAARESCRPSAECNGTQLQERLEQIFAPWRRLQLQGLMQGLTFVTTNSPDDANRPAFVKPITGADEMWFGGGDQEALANLVVDRLRPTLFQQEVQNILRRGGAVGGASAGLAIMPEVMIGGGEAADGRPARATLSRGLGAMKSVLAEQHFDARSGRIERLTGLLRDHKRLANFLPSCQPKNMIGLAVEEDTALIAQANHVRVSGKNLAHVFLQTDNPHEVVWHALKSGDAAILRPAHSGWTLELDDWEFGD